MTIEERFYEETSNMPFQPDYKDKLIDWMKIELQRISDTPILSALPSEKCKELIKQTGEMFDLFKEENIGRYELTQARAALFKAQDYLEVFEERRGIAG